MFTGLSREQIDAVFAGCDHQADVLVGLYKLVFDGVNRPAWADIASIEGAAGASWPTVSEETDRYIGLKFIDFDYRHHPGVLPGGLWTLSRGFSVDSGLPDWGVETGHLVVTLKEVEYENHYHC